MATGHIVLKLMNLKIEDAGKKRNNTQSKSVVSKYHSKQFKGINKKTRQ